jgi:hypothetical protein
MPFRLLIGILLAALAVWSGWWWLGATAKREAIEGWLAERRAAGWVAEAGRVGVTGYPARFDTMVTGLALADPASGWAWEAPEFQILALAYRPNHVVVAWPGAQKLSVPGETVTLGADNMRGSVRFLPRTSLALAELRVEIDALAARSTAGWDATARKARVAFRQAAPGTAPDHPYDLGIEAEETVLPATLKGWLDPAGLLADTVEAVRVDATLAFDAPWDRTAVEGRKPRLSGLALRAGEMVWGDLRLEARGRILVSDAGEPEGDLDIVARNWRKMIRSATAAGLIGEEFAGTLEAGLGVVAALSGGGETLRVPLRFSGGLVSLGPVPLGRAPRFPPPQRQ